MQSGNIPLFAPIFARNIENTGRTELFFLNTDRQLSAMSERLQAQKNDFLKEARYKFPEWNNNAASHLNTLQAANAKRTCKGYDAYLLTYLGRMKDVAEREAEGSASADKRKSPKKGPNLAKSKDPKISDPLLETVDAGLVARAAADDCAHEKDADEEATERDATGKDVDPSRGIRDEDVLLKPADGIDEADLNLQAVQEAEKRELRKRKETPKEPTPPPPPQRKKAIAMRLPIDTESDDENKPLFPKKSSKQSAKKKRKTSEGPIDVDSESEDEKDKKGRFKPKDVSRILAEFDIASIRPLSQQMLLARDGIDVNATAPARLLNMHTILQAAEQKMEGKVFKQFKSALFTSYDEKNDQ